MTPSDCCGLNFSRTGRRKHAARGVEKVVPWLAEQRK